MTDRRDFDRNLDMDRRLDTDPGMAPSGTSVPWEWIAMVVFIILALVLIFSSGTSTQTTRNDVNPPVTTGQAR